MSVLCPMRQGNNCNIFKRFVCNSFAIFFAYFMQGLVFGLLLLPVFYKYVLQMWQYFASFLRNGDTGNNEMKRSLVFYASLAFMLVVVVPSWMQFVHSFHVHPLLWYMLSLGFGLIIFFLTG